MHVIEKIESVEALIHTEVRSLNGYIEELHGIIRELRGDLDQLRYDMANHGNGECPILDID